MKGDQLKSTELSAGWKIRHFAYMSHYKNEIFRTRLEGPVLVLLSSSVLYQKE